MQVNPIWPSFLIQRDIYKSHLQLFKAASLDQCIDQEHANEDAENDQHSSTGRLDVKFQQVKPRQGS